MGKTTFAPSLVLQAAQQGMSVLFFSLQLATPAVARRALAAGAAMASADGPQQDPGSDAELRAQLDVLADLPITLDDGPLFAWLDIINRVREACDLDLRAAAHHRQVSQHCLTPEWKRPSRNVS